MSSRVALVDGEQANVRPIPRRVGIGRLLVIGAVVLFLGLLAYGLAKKSPDDTIDNRLAEGRSAAAPAFSLELLTAGKVPAARREAIASAAADGKVALDELRGIPVVLNFWASWCDPCADESPVLERGWQRWKRRDVLFLGLDMQDLHEDARSFLSELGVTYPSLRDSGKKTSKRYGATGIPETYFISANGRVVAHVVGAVSAQQLDSGVAAARADRPVGREIGGARRPPR
jgi:cytochrome c biogenesis protein CcmG/thiol:disulfide interchange protein DsbE